MKKFNKNKKNWQKGIQKKVTTYTRAQKELTGLDYLDLA